jgi:hypothetical protein
VPGIGIGDRVVVSNAPVVTLSATGVTSTRSCSVGSSVPVKPGVTSKSSDPLALASACTPVGALTATYFVPNPAE